MVVLFCYTKVGKEEPMSEKQPSDPDEPDDTFPEYTTGQVKDGLELLEFELFGSPDAACSSQDTLSGPIDETG